MPGPIRATRLRVTLVALVLLAGCGSSTGHGSSTAPAGSPAPSPAAGSSSSSSAAAPAGSPAAGESSASPSGGAPVSAPASSVADARSGGSCRTSDLALRYLGQQGATGHGEIGVALRNAGPRACRTFGYPGVQFLDRAGGPLPTASTRTTHDFFGSVARTELVVAPGDSVSFRVGVDHGLSSSQGCTTAHGLSVIAPDDTVAGRLTIPEGAYECGTATVSPLAAGESAFP